MNGRRQIIPVNPDAVRRQLTDTIKRRIPHVAEQTINEWVNRNLQFFEIQPDERVTIPAYKVLDFICAQID